MLFALLYLFFWLMLLPLTILVIFVVAALCGCPRRIGRRVYAISIVPLALLSHGLYKYIRPGGGYDPRKSAFPYSFLLVGVFVASAATIGCLLGAFLYRDRAEPRENIAQR
jgi:hypothetical protein